VIDHDAYRIIAITGTDSLNDWLQHNLRWRSKERQGRLIHGGMVTYTSHVLEALHRANMLLRPVPLYLTGHSLGGAAACILPMLTSLPDLAGIVTLGAPPFFADSAQYKFADKLTRVRHVYDLVPDCLPRSHHPAGQEIWLDESGKVTSMNSDVTRRVTRFLKINAARLTGTALKLGTQWHSRKFYADSVSRWCASQPPQ
jgi:hypothetical protein